MKTKTFFLSSKDFKLTLKERRELEAILKRNVFQVGKKIICPYLVKLMN